MSKLFILSGNVLSLSLFLVFMSCSQRYGSGIAKKDNSSVDKVLNRPVNLAANQNVYASASAFTSENESPDKARDNNSTETKWSDSLNHDKWLMYDLGAYCNITSFILYWDTSDKTSKYKIQKSDDGMNWSDVINETTNVSHTKAYQTSLSSVRYVRLLIAAAEDDFVRLMEFQVWGTVAKPLTWTLSFADEFNGQGLPDQTKWDIPEYNRRDNPNGPDGFWRKGYAYQENGNLVIKVDKIANSNNDDDAYDYAVGAIRSINRFTQRFGKFEMRAQLPKKQGWWVAFWMMQGHQGSIGNGGVDGSEVDIMEAWGWTDRINHAIHWDGYESHHATVIETQKVPGIREGFHTYTLEWYPDRYEFFIDGVRKWTTTGGGVCLHPGYLKITGEISTLPWATNELWALDPAGVDYPDYFLVDYVRVYTQN